MTPHKPEIITFKADPELAETIRKLPNASAFIREAVLAALDHLCPLCRGSGILSPQQKRHWNEFARQHPIVECERCHALHVVCECDGHHDHASHQA